MWVAARIVPAPDGNEQLIQDTAVTTTLT